MLSNHLIVWIKLAKKDKVKFMLPFTIPLWVLSEILDSLIEVIIFIDLFIPNKLKRMSSTLELFEEFFKELAHYHGLDLVNVKTKDAEVKIKLL